MRSVLAFFGIYVLAVLLASTFPVGAGDAVHGGALLHPTFPHVHSDTREAAIPPSTHLRVSLAPTIESSPGGATEVPVTALTPPLPRGTLGVLVIPESRLVPREMPRPTSLLHPPPDPPPDFICLKSLASQVQP